MQIAAQHAEAVGKRSGIGVKKRLFLYWVALNSADVSPGHVKFAALIKANFAHTCLAFRNGAAVTASEATNAVAFDRFVQVTFTDLLVQDFTERGQRVPLVQLFYKQREGGAIGNRSDRCCGSEAILQPAAAGKRFANG